MDKKLSALFIDFDNVFISLYNQAAKAAREFGENPGRWLNSLREMREEGDEGPERKFIIRRCYAAPNTFQRYRAHFTRAAFEVLDCPPITRSGKNGADIQMVMDIMDTLRDYPHVTEFVIMSGDSDFLPVITRLRKHDKQTVIYANQFSAAAYRAACDGMIDEGEFIDWLVGDEIGHVAAEAPEPVRSGEAPAATPTPPAIRATTGTGLRPTIDIRALSEALEKNVLEKGGSLPIPSAAHFFRDNHLDAIGEDWGGLGSFKEFLRAVRGPSLTIDWGKDRLTHKNAGTDAIAARGPEDSIATEASPELKEFIRRTARLTGAPDLWPESYHAIFLGICASLQSTPYSITETPRDVLRILSDLGWRIPDRAIGFVLRGLWYQNHVFGPDNQPDILAATFANQLRFLIKKAGLPFDEEARGMVARWMSIERDMVSGGTGDDTEAAASLEAVAAATSANPAEEAAPAAPTPLSAEPPLPGILVPQRPPAPPSLVPIPAPTGETPPPAPDIPR